MAKWCRWSMNRCRSPVITRTSAPPLLKWMGSMCVVPRGPVTKLKTPALALGGSEIRFVKLTQRVPQPSPLVKVLYVRPSLSFVTATAHSILVWDGLTGRIAKVFSSLVDREANEEICDVITDDRERKLIVGTTQGQLLVINLENGAVMKELEPHHGPIGELLYHSSTRRVVSSSWDGSVQISEEESIRGYVQTPYISTLERRILVPLKVEGGMNGPRPMSPLRHTTAATGSVAARQQQGDSSQPQESKPRAITQLLPQLAPRPSTEASPTAATRAATATTATTAAARHHGIASPARKNKRNSSNVAEITALASSEELNLIATASQVGKRR